jgi:hypothetical protein
LREKSNLFDRYVIDVATERVQGRDPEIFWFEDGTPLGQYVRLVNICGTLSGDILRLRRNLPQHQGHFEVDGDTIRPIENPHRHPQRDDDTEDVSAALALLPQIQVDPSRHFVKEAKYPSEIYNLLKCQGGACPGKPLSPHIIQLLGKSANGKLVFERLLPRYLIFHRFCSVAVYKRWILHLIEAVRCLHSLNIIRRDLHLENLLFSADGERQVVADLECRWGQRTAPEIACDDGLDSG